MTLNILVRTLGTHGGTERFTYGFVEWAVAQGHAICVHSVWVARHIEGVEYRPIALHSRGRFFKMAELDMRLQKRAQHLTGPQICMVRGGASPIYRAGGGCHAHWMRSRPWNVGDILERHIDRRVCGSADRIIVNAARTVSLLNQYYSIDPQKCTLLRNGVDLTRFTPDGPCEPRQRPTMIFVGHDFHRKGLDIVFSWLKQLPEWELWVVGADPRNMRFQKQAKALEIHDRIRWLGRVDEPEYWLRSATVCVLPTRYDPAANVCLEALACGTPVLTSTENGASELLWEDWMSIDLKKSVDIVNIFSHIMVNNSELSAAARAVGVQNGASKCYEKLWAICMRDGEGLV